MNSFGSRRLPLWSCGLTLRRIGHRLGVSRWGTPLLLASLLTGCFHYTSVDLPAVSEGASVIAHLDVARDFQSGGITIPQVVAAEGDVVRIDGDSVFVTIHSFLQQDGARHRVSRTPLWFGWTDVRDMEQRTLDRRSSLLAGGGLVLVGGLLARSLFGGDLKEGVGPAPPGDPVATITGLVLQSLGGFFR